MNDRESILLKLNEVDYIDMHIHLENYPPQALSPSILFLGNSMNRKSYEKTLALSKACPTVIPAFGIHPARAAEADYSREEIASLIKKNTLVGEIGLDFHWVEDRSSDPRQREIFDCFLKAMQKGRSIPSIHTKGAEQEILLALKKERVSPFIIHWYSGPKELIPPFLELGAYFTIGPDIFTDSDVYRHIPLNRMFAETDNPTGVPWICQSVHRANDIIKVYKKLSEKLQIPLGDLQKLFKENMRALLA